MYSPLLPPISPVAITGSPKKFITLVTLIPFPPGVYCTSFARKTFPFSNPLTTHRLSIEGFKVMVKISLIYLPPLWQVYFLSLLPQILILSITTLFTASLPGARYFLGSLAVEFSSKYFLIASVKAIFNSVDILILQIPNSIAFFTSSVGTLEAP